MAHRILLSEKAVLALSKIEESLKLRTEYSVRQQRNALVNEIISMSNLGKDDEQIEALVERITPPSRRRKALVKRLEAITQGLDEETMRSVEASLNKLGKAVKRKSLREEKASSEAEPQTVVA